MDEKDRVNDPHKLECRELDDALDGKRKIMMDRIQHKLVQYGEWPMQRRGCGSYILIKREAGELLCLSSKLAALERPSTFDRTSVLNFFLGMRPIAWQENYIGNTPDLVTLNAISDDAWLDRQILRLLVKTNNRVLSVSSVCPIMPNCSLDLANMAYRPKSGSSPIRWVDAGLNYHK